ncbi:hypothetical protein ABBQ32_002032 [Trebouxia sp. C0010 RCD-2024]
MLSAGVPHWALAAPDMADQTTATSPLQPSVKRPPIRTSSSISGFMMTNFEADNSNGLKGQGSGPLPFAGWEDPPLGALHHLHQVHQGFSMPAGQLLSLDDPPHAECQYSNLVLEGHSYFPGHSILPFPVSLPMVHPPSPQHHMDPQVIVNTSTF